MPNERRKWRPRKIFAWLGFSLLLMFMVWKGLELLVEKAIHRVAAGVEKAGYVIRFDAVDVGLFERRLELQGASIAPMGSLSSSDSLPYFNAKADRAGLRGVDMMALLFEGVLHVERLYLEKPTLLHSRITGKMAEHDRAGPGAPAELQGTLLRIRIDTLRVDDAAARSTDRHDTASTMVMERMDILITGLHAVETRDGRLQVLHDAANLEIHGISMPVRPFHTLAIGRLELDARAGLLRTTDLSMVPRYGPKDYHKHVSHQSELVSFTADTLMASGFDLASNIRIGALLARSIQLHGLKFHTYRDKSLPEDPAIRKPLPQRTLRGLSFPIAVDSLSFSRASVHYSERMAREEEYGTISFTGIHGILTGLSNLQGPSPSDIHLIGHSRLYGRGSLMLDMIFHMADDADGLTAHATVRNVPFEVLNRMTDNLVHVNATEGRIELVELRFRGNEHKAQGTVDVHYEDLKLALSPSVQHAKALSFLANTLVRSSNIPNERRYRRGEFNVERAGDKGVFNYLWRGTREGMMEVMLPPMLLKRIQKERERQQTAQWNRPVQGPG